MAQPKCCVMRTQSGVSCIPRVVCHAYLVNLGEEAGADELGTEVLPELQLADGGAEAVPAVHLAVAVRGLAQKRRAPWLRSHIHLTHPRDLVWGKRQERERGRRVTMGHQHTHTQACFLSYKHIYIYRNIQIPTNIPTFSLTLVSPLTDSNTKAHGNTPVSMHLLCHTPILS